VRETVESARGPTSNLQGCRPTPGPGKVERVLEGSLLRRKKPFMRNLIDSPGSSPRNVGERWGEPLGSTPSASPRSGGIRIYEFDGNRPAALLLPLYSRLRHPKAMNPQEPLPFDQFLRLGSLPAIRSSSSPGNPRRKFRRLGFLVSRARTPGQTTIPKTLGPHSLRSSRRTWCSRPRGHVEGFGACRSAVPLCTEDKYDSDFQEDYLFAGHAALGRTEFANLKSTNTIGGRLTRRRKDAFDCRAKLPPALEGGGRDEVREGRNFQVLAKKLLGQARNKRLDPSPWLLLDPVERPRNSVWGQNGKRIVRDAPQ